MDAIRAFIAIELPEETRQQLNKIIQKMQEQLAAYGGDAASKAVRWVPPDNIHVTLKFLGEISSANIQALASMLKAEASRHASFTLNIGGCGAFPNLHRPRVIWVGSDTSGDTPGKLSTLQESIENESRILGYPPEERSFSPHLTLGRVSQNASAKEIGWISATLEAVKVGSLGSVQVDAIHLFRSDLHPNGAVYTSLYAFQLEKSSSKS